MQCNCLKYTSKGSDYISTNDYISNLLNIKDKNIFILSNKLENRKIKGSNYQIIEAILTYNPDYTLKATYECYQEIINSIKNIIYHNKTNISDKMKQSLKLYRENIKYIENSFKYDINNDVIEGKNNLIKCLKRIAFGYRKYDHFIARIFLIKGIIKG